MKVVNRLSRFLLIALIALLLSACSDEISKVSETNDNQQTEETQKIVQNEELTKSILEEEGVIAGKAYEQDGLAVGTLSLEADVSDEDTKKLAEKYAGALKKEYKDLPVNVQAVRDGENVVNISLD